MERSHFEYKQTVLVWIGFVLMYRFGPLFISAVTYSTVEMIAVWDTNMLLILSCLVWGFVSLYGMPPPLPPAVDSSWTFCIE
jgi:hypothetical protein